MQDFLKSKVEAWKAHAEEWDCEHAQVVVRIRTIKGGSTQYVNQCLKCGSSVGNPLRKSDFAGELLQPFDIQLQDCWDQKRKDAVELLKERFARGVFFENYDEYLKSAEWASKRSKVLARANGVCEGCGDGAPNEVHHLTYQHVGKEFLFELVALCHGCHERVHDDQ